MNVNRFSFIYSILGLGVGVGASASAVAKAQTTGTVRQQWYGQDCDAWHPCGGNSKIIGWLVGKAVNNQCPLCGTMAAKYEREPDYYSAPKNCKPVSDNKYLVVCDPITALAGPMKRITCCAKCSNAFWQTAEE